jgi:hypothetical protein
MLGYVTAALHKFQHAMSTRPADAPHAWNQPTYSAKIQYAPEANTTMPVTPPQVMHIQQVIGTLMYYSIAIDSMMLVALGTITAAQATATEHTTAAIIQLLNYAATHPDATIW